ncbi:hypothetical protein EBR96_10155 [bacterium]|nr:hypothetical protein [bacterium]
MRDHINRSMFSVVKEEYLKVEAVASQNPGNKSLASRRKELFEILTRLKTESNIGEDIKPDTTTRVASSDVSIVEAA